MKKLLKDDLIMGFISSILGIILAFILGFGFVPVILGWVGFLYCKKGLAAEKSKSNSKRKSLGIIGMVVGIGLTLLFFFSYFHG